jgi:predicted metal-dependent hydrolase
MTSTTPGKRFVLQGDRRKAFRPLSPEQRRQALDDGLAAYDRGDFFEAHELLEPAWMGTDDLGERAFLQGLIKLAAAFVHAARGNPLGVAKNLAGARDRLRTEGAAEAAALARVDVALLLDRIEARLMEPELSAIRIPRGGQAAATGAAARRS